MRDEFWSERRDHIATCAYMGMSQAEAARDTGLSAATILTYSRRFGIKFADKRGRKKVSFEDKRAELQSLADAGGTVAQAADQLGISYATAIRRINELGIKFRHASASLPGSPRADAMASMYRAGKTLDQIGQLYGVTRERVRQIISKEYRLTGSDGGQHIKAKVERERRRAEKEAECYQTHGCSLSQLKELRRIGREMRLNDSSREVTPIGAFVCQRSNARSRGVGWSLKLWEWWSIWQQSGKWAERGRAADAYVMCRFRDEGPYEIGNVYIATLRHNSTVQPNNKNRVSHPQHSEVFYDHRQNSIRRDGHRTAHFGLPRGVTVHKKTGRYMAQITIRGERHYLGMFGSPEAAHAAYLAAVPTVAAREVEPA